MNFSTLGSVCSFLGASRKVFKAELKPWIVRRDDRAYFMFLMEKQKGNVRRKGLCLLCLGSREALLPLTPVWARAVSYHQ